MGLPAPGPCGSMFHGLHQFEVRGFKGSFAFNPPAPRITQRWVGQACFSSKSISSEVSLPAANSFLITKEMSSEEHLPLEGHTGLHTLSCHGPELVVPTGQLLQGSAAHDLFLPRCQACRAAPFSCPGSFIYLRKRVLLGPMALPAQTGCLLGPGTALLNRGVGASPNCFSHPILGQTDSSEINSRTENCQPRCPREAAPPNPGRPRP